MRAGRVDVGQIAETAAQLATCENLAAVINELVTYQRDIAARNDFSGMGFGDDGFEFGALQIDVLRPGRDVIARKTLVVIFDGLIECFAPRIGCCSPVVECTDLLLMAGFGGVVVRPSLVIRGFLCQP